MYIELNDIFRYLPDLLGPSQAIKHLNQTFNLNVYVCIYTSIIYLENCLCQLQYWSERIKCKSSIIFIQSKVD